MDITSYSRIILYRDGVSEGQFNAVLQHELLAIRYIYSDIILKDKSYL